MNLWRIYKFKACGISTASSVLTNKYTSTSFHFPTVFPWPVVPCPSPVSFSHFRFGLDLASISSFSSCCGSSANGGNLWCFEEGEYLRESEDPFVAAIQVLYDIVL